ncbi:MAG: uL30 family ribosomal protein [Candidatus Woesearchaeota archaeon]
MDDKKYIAAIWIRGLIKVDKERKDTIRMLGFKKKNNCVILENTPSNLGMLMKVKDYVTWGEIDNETLELLKSKRENLSKKPNKMIFALHPPIKGFEDKGIKKSFKQGGVLGYRGEKINDLIKRMIALF